MTRPTLPGTLQRKSQLPVWLSIGWRVTAVVGLVGLAIAVHWFDRAGLRDNYDGAVSFLDVVYFTMISITTTGYGDIAPVSERARLFDALIVTPIRVFVVLLFIGTAYDFVLKRTWDKWRMSLLQRTLKGHIVVAGYGHTGAEAVAELIARGEAPDRIVVVDPDADRIAEAKDVGCLVLEGDATRDQTLSDIHLPAARLVIVTAGRDDTSILITLSARHLAPDVPISTVVRNEDNELPARAAGATTVINPVSFAGLLLATSHRGGRVTEYLTDLASMHGQVRLRERPIAADEVGLALSSLSTGTGLRVYRDGTSFGRHQSESSTLRAGDTIVEIVAT
ncbi:potassium transporter TrkA [Sphingomonas sp. Leaf33]|uniref:potassium channel family protein n=1 Tax=Sphingomonas sp. Leaf33 TaxID=1736215 RepID=UPI0006F1E23A|nr:potassium channel family protein [Sphingomonas sp. Leaf33]KQN26423.1 potassium transporter TrkA [Sphingomonas sp. Leaf33]